jgi:subtilase family serine protease
MLSVRRYGFRVLIVAALASQVASSQPSSAPAAEDLKFVPLIKMGPRVSRTALASGGGVTQDNVHYYFPSDVTAAYGVDAVHAQGLTGVGQTIVVVDAYGSPTALEDLQQFSQDFRLPAPKLTIYHPCGTPTFNNAMHGEPAGWGFETNLDLQWAHAIAPDAELVMIAANPSETQGVQGLPCMFKGIQWAIENYPGAVISQSFGVTEQSFHAAASTQVAKYRKAYQDAVANRITVLASSGDWGTANTDKQDRLFSEPNVIWPSSDPLVTSVGGTWLQYGWKWNPLSTAAGFYACLAANPAQSLPCYQAHLNFVAPASTTEAVWKEDWIQAATGGGRSALFSTPSFQADLPSSLLQGARGLPDVSWNAAVDGGVLVYIGFLGEDSGYYILGGTSASSPQLAALVALANQRRHQLSKLPIGYLNPVLYQLPANVFTDTLPSTFGTNGGVATTLNSNEQFGTGIPGLPTTTGWDLTTGFGSPKAAAFVAALAAVQ